jgi:hypothetical protein
MQEEKKLFCISRQKVKDTQLACDVCFCVCGEKNRMLCH